jgi:predicted DNA-binding ribbon-helix-helix protein
MKSPVVKRSIAVAGHKTGVSLEEAFWNGMKEISALRNMTLSELVGETDGSRQQGNLSSAIRLFVLDYFKKRAAFHLANVRARLQRVPGSSPGAPTKAFQVLTTPRIRRRRSGAVSGAEIPNKPLISLVARQDSGSLPHQLRYPFGFANPLGIFLTRMTGLLQ